MNILVTGGAGAIGRYVVHDLAAHGLVPTILDLGPPPEREGGFRYVQCDLVDLDATLDAVRGYDVVVHLAAIPNPFAPPFDLRKAKRLLGWKPTKSWQTFEQWEKASIKGNAADPGRRRSPRF
jgi:NAD(P)-dependent dehydrogenase (short-subunit alcohol dehydrogenase family)